jgi:hypothetical protein
MKEPLFGRSDLHPVRQHLKRLSGILSIAALLPLSAAAQTPPQGPPNQRPGGRNQERAIVDQFDNDKDGRLNAEERAKAIEFIKANPQSRGGRGNRFRGPGGRGRPGGPEARGERGRPGGPEARGERGRPGGPEARGERRGPGGPEARGERRGPGGPEARGERRGPSGRGGRGENRPAASPGIPLTSADVRHFPNAPLYEASVLRTFFIEFENPQWESELVAFNNTDVEVPAKVTVDGSTYTDVGIHFRGNSSFGVGDGYKRSLNLSFDFVHDGQAVQGYRTLNFLNANADPTFLHTVLSLQITRQYIPAPKANLVRVVINGENWGIYANQQQFNKDFLQDNYDTKKGTRWKIPQGGGGGGVGAFRYMGDDVDNYRGVFQIKSKDKPKAWEALIGLARTLDQTPTDQLQSALEPILDMDSYLKFLAIDNALVSGDGFWTRGADYSLYLHPDGRFRLILYDANEMFSFRGGRRGRGPGGGGNYQGGTGVDLEPLAGLSDPGKPIIERILSVPALRTKYLSYVREIAEQSLDWKTTGPVVKQYRDLIKEDVERDSRKLFSTEQFLKGTGDEPLEGNLRDFFDQRRTALLEMKVLQ